MINFFKVDSNCIVSTDSLLFDELTKSLDDSLINIIMYAPKIWAHTHFPLGCAVAPHPGAWIIIVSPASIIEAKVLGKFSLARHLATSDQPKHTLTVSGGTQHIITATT